MAIRPSWIEVDVEGRKTLIETGPRSRSGSMHIKIYVRSNGEVEKIADIDLLASQDKSRVILLADIDGESRIRREYTQ
jgi:hypothetical protein